MSVLAAICDKKREHVAACKALRPLAQIRDALKTVHPTRGFEKRLRDFAASGKTALITEIKKASPSVGLIRADFDPAALARAYEKGGSACLSVLTEGPSFQGRDEDLIAARNACKLPVLRKDFTIDEYQIFEARALGADCILLIMAALDDATAADFHACAKSLGLGVLVEIHDRPELDRALKFAPTLIGVNNRNLKTLKVDLATAESLAPHIPSSAVKIAESGIGSSADIARLKTAGYNTFLIGESLMRQPDVTQAVQNILS